MMAGVEAFEIVKLRLLRDVAARGSIAATARALGYTPSAVSQQLAALEKRCGTLLLERTHKGVTLTPAGRLLERRAQRVLDELERAEAEMAVSSIETGGLVRVGTFATAGVAICPRAAVTLARDHPHLEVRLLEQEPTHQPQAVLLGDLDVGIVVSWDHAPSPVPPELVSRRVLSEHMFIAHPAAMAPPRSLRDLRDQPWVASPDSTVCGRATRAACRGVGFDPTVVHVTDDFSVALAYTAAGLGVSMIPPLALHDRETPPGTVLTLVQPRITRHIEVIVRASNAGHPAVRAVVEALAESAQVVADRARPGVAAAS
jgi:DNA-binding transcriptional LysR family regulator